MRTLPTPMHVVGAGAVSAAGLGWRGLGAALTGSRLAPAVSSQLACGFPQTLASEVSEIPEGRTPAERRARSLMSRSALLASLATETALGETGWSADRTAVGFYMGVGASGGSIEQLEAMLSASIDQQRFSHERFGAAGLAAVNPLFAFQLMNNFTLCHSAIQAGTRGPNAAFFSRGGGTLLALSEALFALTEGTCSRALTGAADSSVHPVTWAELTRQGYPKGGYVPGEAAALLALERRPDRPSLAVIERCELISYEQKPLARALAELWRDPGSPAPSGIVVAPWGTTTREALSSWASQCLPGAPLLDTSRVFGDALAAAPALAWLCGLDLLLSEHWQRVLVLSAGVDEQLGAVVLAREARA